MNKIKGQTLCNIGGGLAIGSQMACIANGQVNGVILATWIAGLLTLLVGCGRRRAERKIG